MSQNIPAFYVQQYASNVDLLLQQRGSRLGGAVTIGNYIGKSAQVVDQMGAIEMQDVNGRFEPMGRVDAAMDSRWVFPVDKDLPQLLDSFDKLRLLTDPKSKYVENAVAAAGRFRDKAILQAALGTAKTGENGGTSTVLPAGQKIASGFGSGDIVNKIIEGKRLLMAANVDVEMDPIFMAITADEHAELLAASKVVSLDYNTTPVLVNGMVKQFLGVNFIHTELVTINDSGGEHLCPMWAKSGLHLGIWNEITTDIAQRKDLKGLPWQAYVYMTIGATRTEEQKVVQIAFA